ncbi:amino acid transporter AVT1E-like [Selaginella moellendorffii]|uniref:amino acid transporter AVT1E-like n=1 Tax=Selaginella moellendorffii TaxID=88036 RepID=UPI000D1C683E|nr:amino acid transporter AVT1E-like [Selaginella moellendorffii]|eukprot:XP_024541148.1 amino acid transporter AVT1E-like [Selaginella moellendorffii]
MEHRALEVGQSLDQNDQAQNKLQRSSFLHATFNSVSAILGISFLTTPYALEQGGWLGLSILFAFSVICCYTAYVLGRCLTPNGSYNTIAEAAFGSRARLPFTLLVQFEMIAVLVGYTISMGDNLARLFPHATLRISALELGPSKVLLFIAFLVVLPTVWLRNLAWISYLSLFGIVTYMIITVTMIYAGAGLGIGFHHSVPHLRPENLLNIAGIYAYCFAAHCALPSVYTSLKNPSNYAKVLVLSFMISTMVYIGFAFLGGTMFGDYTLPQVSLNIPTHLVAAKLVLWMVVLLPFSKYSLCLAPIALDIESKFPWPNTSRSFVASTLLLRTGLLIFVFLLAMVFPYFETMVAFIGSASGMLVAVTLPSLFYLRIYRNVMPKWEAGVNYAILAVGTAVGMAGTIASIINFVHRIRS